MTKIIPYERNQYALWYDEEPDFMSIPGDSEPPFR